jgi:hypothetical protein
MESGIGYMVLPIYLYLCTLYLIPYTLYLIPLYVGKHLRYRKHERRKI